MYAAQGDMVYVGVAAHQTLSAPGLYQAIEPLLFCISPALVFVPSLIYLHFKFHCVGPCKCTPHHPPHEPS
jgi:hypothetical protein